LKNQQGVNETLTKGVNRVRRVKGRTARLSCVRHLLENLPLERRRLEKTHQRLKKSLTRNASFFGLAPGSLQAFSRLLLCLLALGLTVAVGLAQSEQSTSKQEEEPSRRLRVERTTLGGGGELLTIWGRVVASREAPSSAGESETGVQAATEEVPLISVLRDTLGDANRKNDVLREVWVHTYVRPKLAQHAAALVPFLYKGVSVDPHVPSKSPPPAIINLSDTGKSVWRRLLVSTVAYALIDEPLLKASVHNYQRNIADYRKSNLMRALTILSLYGNQPKSDSPFSEAELAQLQSQLALNERTFGGLVDKIHFSKFKEREEASLKDTRGHNWELLRQQAETSGLYFEPLKLSDKTVTHAVLWFPADGVVNKDPNHPYQGRFLNIKNPWQDQRLSRWKGYTEKKYFNLDNQLVSGSDPSSSDQRAVTMIPLAVYGLDFQKIPALLIDFRDSANPRRRELSGRLLNDITRDVLSISRFGNVYYFVARSAFDFVTSRRGIDINQPSRLRSAAELRLVLSFNPDINDGLRAELSKGLGNLSVNPMENGSKTERDLAFAQYRALRAYAVRADGLPARLEQERGAELAKLKHRGWDGRFLRVANILTLGHYTHREKVTPESRQQLHKERELTYHTTFLRQVARSTPIVEVSWNLEEVRESLRYISENGSIKDKESAKAVASIFSRTNDGQARDLCLSALMRIGNKVAMREMLRIYSDARVPVQWRTASAEYLKIDPPQQSNTVGVIAEPQPNGSQQP
jgi:hypothetical protein